MKCTHKNLDKAKKKIIGTQKKHCSSFTPEYFIVFRIRTWAILAHDPDYPI